MQKIETLKDFDKKFHRAQVDGLVYLRAQESLLIEEQEQYFEAERVLDFLRPFKLAATEVEEDVLKAWKKARNGTRPHEPTAVGDITPNVRFAHSHPTAAATYGEPFIETPYEYAPGATRITIEAINEDSFAKALEGEPYLTHKVVYYAQEERFYFYDHRFVAFRPTTEAKLKSLLSNILIRCSEGCHPSVDRKPLYKDFREAHVLDRIIETAKVILEACPEHFRFTNSRRFVDGHYIESDEESLDELFVREVLDGIPGARLTLQDAFESYQLFYERKGVVLPELIAFQNRIYPLIKKTIKGTYQENELMENENILTWRGVTSRFHPVGYSRN